MKNICKVASLAILLSACVGNESNDKSGSHSNMFIHKLKDSQISFLNTSSLDAYSSTCYSTVHYYDQPSKISLSVNDNGDVGGMISALEHTTDSQNTCNLHLYKWNAAGFQTTQFANTEIDCSNRSECTLDAVKLSNTGLYSGKINATMADGMWFVSDGTHFNLESKDYFNNPSLSTGFRLTNVDSLSFIYKYDRETQIESMIKNYDGGVATNNYYDNYFFNDNKLTLLSMRDDYSQTNPSRSMYNIYDMNTNQDHFYKGRQLSSDYLDYTYLQLNALSNNNQYVYGVEYKNKKLGNANILQIVNLELVKPNAGYLETKISAFPFDTDNVAMKVIQVVNDGTLLLGYMKYSLDGTSKVQVTNRKLFYSTVSGNYYDLNDLLTVLNLTQYASQITEIQMSENANYMMFVLNKNGKTSTIAIKMSFINGIDSFLQANLQPIQS